MRLLSYGAILAAICCPLDANGAARERFIPDCAGQTEIAHAHVARVERDGTLILADGRSLVLEGIRMEADKAVAGQLLAALRGMALDGPVSFTTRAPTKDRYGRTRVQAFGRLWFQAALLERGLARVQISPDRDECAPDLYEAEGQARDRQAGLWASPGYRLRTPQTLDDTAGTFRLVEGKADSVGKAGGRTFIDFGGHGDKHRPFSVVIEARDRHAFRDFDFDGLSGRRIRVRGIVQDDRGRPEIMISNPYQIELLN